MEQTDVIETGAPLPASVAQALKAFIEPRRFALAEGERQLLQSGRAQRIAHEGAELAAWTWRGAREAAPPPRVLLVHGWESRASHWGAWVPALTAAGFDVCVFDAPAHGDSAGTTSDVVACGRAIGSVARALGPFDMAIGHSAGSAAALYAFAHGLEVRASVHLAGPSSLVRVLAYVARAAGLPEDLRPLLRERFERYLGQPATVMDLARLAPGLRHPALLLHDPEDAEMPYAESVALARAWPQAELVPAAGLGHRRILKDADVVARAVAFLQRHARPAVPGPG
ncbi:alpha/beta hydrolase [Cupriavidus basilensis]|uniref:Alpha/beta hydrolase n=1 Tax=Cupriavidus basilensis TaxID=68895 RepID=A0ABT6APM8_9BURK|nr:alpha/beta hydrolase [Cupriavidus basilensis]MDF3834584.1 alpha/beta hydrolase [Cupriavidus basilensis]